MIIEAEPRQGDGPLGGYQPSRIVFETETSWQLEKQPRKSFGQKFQVKNLKSRGRKSRSFTEGRFGGDRLAKELASGPLSKCRNKTFNRDHPYGRDEVTRAGNTRWDLFLSTLPCRKCPSLLQPSARRKSLSLSDFFQQYRRREETLPTSKTLLFTANANENNDNCPSTVCRYGEFGVTPGTDSSSSHNPDQLCDVEIEDLTTATHSPADFSDFFSDQDNSWRQRRKSFNTNPLSCSEPRETADNLPSLLSFGEISSDHYTGQYPVVEQQPPKSQVENQVDKLNSFKILDFPQDETQVGTWSTLHNQPPTFTNSGSSIVDWEASLENIDGSSGIDDSKYLTSSIEKLVEFFEANTSHRAKSIGDSAEADTNWARNKTDSITQSPEDANITQKTSNNSNLVPRSRKQVEKGLRQLHRPSTSPGTSCNQTSPIDFSSLFRGRGVDTGTRTSPVISQAPQREQSHSRPNFSPGGLYNNNANAASASCESRLGWTKDHYHAERFPRASCHKNPPKSSLPTLSSSTTLLPSNRGRNTSSLSPLSRVSADVELIDLESTRLSSWPGTHSIPAAFERQRYQPSNCRGFNHQYSEKLIDLQTTSNRTQAQSKEWFTKGDCNLASKERQRSQGLSGFLHNFQQEKAREGRRENCYQNCFRPIRSHENKVSVVNRASANNHHNEPTICSQDTNPTSEIGRLENLCSDSREKQFPFGNFAFHHSLLSPLLRRKPNFGQSDQCEMGCIQSIAKAKVSPDRCHHGVIVEDIHAAIDRIPTEIEEKSPIVLRYRTPYFRASAHVIVPPIPRKETWTVGWIQACDSMKFINQYGDLGNSSWEIPALKDRRVAAVSDSDGVSYPWYGNTTEIATVEGPTDTSRSLTLRMNDNFYPSVTWDIPVSEGSEAHLTHIVRDQSFTTWLAAVNQTTGRLEVLRTVKWHFYLEIDVDPTQELGKRARIVSPVVQKQPVILKNNTEPIYISSPHRSAPDAPTGNGGRQRRVNRRPGAGGDNNSNNHTNFIPKSALVRPSANNAQTLIWRPTGDLPVIVVPAKEEYKENNEVVWFTRTPTMHGHDHNVRILSLQETAKLKKTMSRQ